MKTRHLILRMMGLVSIETSLAQELAPRLSADYRRIAPDKPLLPDLSEENGPEQAAEASQLKAMEEGLSEMMDEAGMAARESEAVILPVLRGIVLIDEEGELIEEGLEKQRGVDLSQVEIEGEGSLAFMLGGFVGKPASFESIGRIRLAVRHHLRTQGRPFSLVYTPPQDVTSGSLQIFVKPSKIEPPLQVEGAKYFSEKLYQRQMKIDLDGPIDQDQLNKDAKWISKNPYRNAVVVTEAGSEPGTTALGLRVKETRPWRVNAGYENTGTPTSGEHRLKAGFNWGNAFGRGDLLDYSYRTDSDFELSKSHSVNYTTFLPWYHQLTVFGAYSEVESDLPAPLDQIGESWQLGTRYSASVDDKGPLTHGWVLGLDLKASDNTLSVDQMPVFNNPTRIIQLSAGYQASLQRETSASSGAMTLFWSPGGIGSKNSDEAFAGSRAMAEASYFYGTLNLSHRQRLPARMSWSSALTAQLSSTNLLGSEQLAASGAYGVRGYAENDLYADHGILLRNELSLPSFSPTEWWMEEGRDEVQFYLFADYAWTASHDPLPDEPSSVDAGSVGAGFSYRWAENVSANVCYGHKLIELNEGEDAGRWHVNVQVSF